MSLSAQVFGRDSAVFKITNVLGLGVPGYLDKKMSAGGPLPQRLGEISSQTAKEGEPRVIVYGLVRPIGGNIIHCQAPIRKMVEQSVPGGKGGKKKKKQKVEHVYRTYAVGVCEGPITGFGRIWRNNKLVYDGRGTAWGIANNSVFLSSFSLHLGGWDQQPSAALTATWGIGNVPAYRGTAYIAALNEDLTSIGGAVPQFIFEVERAEGRYLTTKPYAMELLDALAVSPSTSTLLLENAGPVNLDQNPESLAAVPALVSWSLSDLSPTIKDNLAPAPAVTSIGLSLLINKQLPDNLAPTPAVTSIGLSLLINKQLPDNLAPTPAVTEITLT
ncbi:MAG: hypothetical protein K2X80_05405 [Pseudomonadaceae bacterium]|nr:hypothetical protein [Pseudomonadaceae bacterium]